MFKKLFLVSLILILCSAFLVPERVEKKANKEIKKFYEIESFSKEPYSFSEKENKATISEFRNENLFKINSNGVHIGYGYIGNAPSKTATFDYLVLFDTNLIVTKSKVLLYREEYGGEIGSRRWLQQFIGVPITSKELVYNRDIIPISGATISVQSMTKAMNNLLKSMRFLEESKLL